MNDRPVEDIIILFDGFIENFGLYCAEWEDMSEQSKRQWVIEFCREHARPIDIKELEVLKVGRAELRRKKREEQKSRTATYNLTKA